ncbi:MAG: phosphopantetheine-binding protein [Pseudomonadota bacterium]
MKNEIRERVLSLLGSDNQQLGDDDSLVVSGRLSSVKVIELATWLEEKYHIDFYAHTFHVKDFDSVNSILKLVEDKIS